METTSFVKTISAHCAWNPEHHTSNIAFLDLPYSILSLTIFKILLCCSADVVGCMYIPHGKHQLPWRAWTQRQACSGQRGHCRSSCPSRWSRRWRSAGTVGAAGPGWPRGRGSPAAPATAPAGWWSSAAPGPLRCMGPPPSTAATGLGRSPGQRNTAGEAERRISASPMVWATGWNGNESILWKHAPGSHDALPPLQGMRAANPPPNQCTQGDPPHDPLCSSPQELGKTP